MSNYYAEYWKFKVLYGNYKPIKQGEGDPKVKSSGKLYPNGEIPLEIIKQTRK